MSVHFSGYFLRCNAVDCHSLFSPASTYSKTDARVKAAVEGWTHPEGNVDICPEHPAGTRSRRRHSGGTRRRNSRVVENALIVIMALAVLAGAGCVVAYERAQTPAWKRAHLTIPELNVPAIAPSYLPRTRHM